ncbi:DapH/DapD/GlmU-related protein [[Enterobacter] lignolyticus]|uniref:Capsule polysaccharide biosynthesis protein n=1 Tax=Enterobacter lignolyticus (strain SCF1) TaxID=701347 RepID=E3GCY5_ENTLS|nr:Capsule polysaccharide biosynthesis protein [[Enterobacter] lignolyticus SCF1]
MTTKSDTLIYPKAEDLVIKKTSIDDNFIHSLMSRYQFASRQLTKDMTVLNCGDASGVGHNYLSSCCEKIFDYVPDFTECGDNVNFPTDIISPDAIVLLNLEQYHQSLLNRLIPELAKLLKSDGQLIISFATDSAVTLLLKQHFYHLDIYIQNQELFHRTDDPIEWGNVIAICQYPIRSNLPDNYSKPHETKYETCIMNDNGFQSSISISAQVAESVIYKPTFNDGIYIFSDGVQIRDNAVLENHNRGRLVIGKNTVIGYNCWLNATGDIEIGSDTLIGANTIITSSSHHFKDNVPVSEQGMSFKKVTIGSNVWIGSNVSILEGVVIGDNSVIGAGVVVKENIPPNTIIKAGSTVVIEKIKKNTVLFYLLPFMIRGSALTFECIYEKYRILAASFAAQDWNIVFVATDELAKKISNDGWFTISPQAYNISYDDGIWFERWKRTLLTQYDEMHSLFVTNILEDINPEIVFCWNFDGILKNICSEKAIAAYFNELGLSRSPNPLIYYSDASGVNATSNLKNFWRQFNNFTLSENEKTIARLTLGEVKANYVIRDERKAEIHKALSLSNKKTVLIALQVEDDSNIVAGSKFTSMQQFVDLCLRFKRDDLQFIIKKHPGDKNCSLYVKDYPIVVDEFSTCELIAISDHVFTINSSVGFEALLAGKTIFTFGNAPYCVDDLVNDFSAFEEDSMIPVIEEKRIDPDLLHKFVYLTYHNYFLSEQKFFNAEFHIRRHLLQKINHFSGTQYFFDSGSYFKDREIQVNRYQNKVLQNTIRNYEAWVEQLKETERRAIEVSEWAQMLNTKLQKYERIFNNPLTRKIAAIRNAFFKK